MGTIRKSDTGLFSVTRSPKSDVIHVVRKIRESSHFTIKSSHLDFLVSEKSEVQVHHLVFNENPRDFPSIP